MGAAVITGVRGCRYQHVWMPLPADAAVIIGGRGAYVRVRWPVGAARRCFVCRARVPWCVPSVAAVEQSVAVGHGAAALAYLLECLLVAY